jgi:hypothetical protein
MFACGPFGKSETNMVWCDDTKAGRDERPDKLAIQERPGGIPVQQQYWIALAFVDEVHAMAIHRHEPTVERKGGTDLRGQCQRRRPGAGHVVGLELHGVRSLPRMGTKQRGSGTPEKKARHQAGLLSYRDLNR